MKTTDGATHRTSHQRSTATSVPKLPVSPNIDMSRAWARSSSEDETQNPRGRRLWVRTRGAALPVAAGTAAAADGVAAGRSAAGSAAAGRARGSGGLAGQALRGLRPGLRRMRRPTPAVLVIPLRPSASYLPRNIIPVDIPVYHTGQCKLLPGPRFVTGVVSVKTVRTSTPRSIIEPVL